jgi:hypothetical protein
MNLWFWSIRSLFFFYYKYGSLHASSEHWEVEYGKFKKKGHFQGYQKSDAFLDSPYSTSKCPEPACNVYQGVTQILSAPSQQKSIHFALILMNLSLSFKHTTPKTFQFSLFWNLNSVYTRYIWIFSYWLPPPPVYCIYLVLWKSCTRCIPTVMWDDLGEVGMQIVFTFAFLDCV